jgi:hypothetical protein
MKCIYLKSIINNKFNYNIQRKYDVSNCLAQEFVLCTDNYHIDVLNDRFDLDTIYNFETCYLLQLK